MAEQSFVPTAVIRTEGAVIKFTESYDGFSFSARLTVENGHVVLAVTPKRPVSFDELSVVCYADPAGDDRVFMNGYQSWTDSCELTVNDRMRGILQIPAPLVRKYDFDKYGDYNFARYSLHKGVLHGWTYCYIRSGDEYCLCGSLSERCGFTKMTLIAEKKRLKLSRDCEGAVYTKAFNAIDCVFLTGSEDEVFDSWCELYDSRCESRDVPALLRGYTSWYRHYQDISEDKLLHDLDALISSEMPTDIFQIDDGFQQAVGDWLLLDKNKFPNGISPIAERIHAEGLKAGLWLAPFVCEKNSSLMREHPDWTVKDKNGAPLPAGCNWSGSYALDIYNEEFREYLREVFDTVLNKWGFDLVKLDFLYAACILPKYGKSRGEMMCDAMDFLRELCGDKLILGCGVPLGAAFGKVDYCRIGCDVGLMWNDTFVMQQTHRERVSTRNSMLNTVFRRQLNGRFFRNDPDVFLLRNENNSLSPRRRQSLTLINHIFGSVLFTSDDVGTYDEKQKRVLSQARDFIGCTVRSVGYENDTLTVRAEAKGRSYTLKFDFPNK